MLRNCKSLLRADFTYHTVFVACGLVLNLVVFPINDYYFT